MLQFIIGIIAGAMAMFLVLGIMHIAKESDEKNQR